MQLRSCGTWVTDEATFPPIRTSPEGETGKQFLSALYLESLVGLPIIQNQHDST